MKFNYLGIILITAIILSNISFLLLNSNYQNIESNGLFNQENNGEIKSIKVIDENKSPSFDEKSEEIVKESQNTVNPPRNLLGNNSGTGAGNYLAYDSAILTSTDSLSTQNNLVSFLPNETHSDNLIFSTPSSFTRNTGSFSITDVNAVDDWRLIEDKEYTRDVDSDPANDAYFEVSMSFTVPEDNANITSVRIYTAGAVGGSGSPNASIYIVNSTVGEQPDETDILSSKVTLTQGAEGWQQLNFANHAKLQGGRKYFVVLNDTSPADYGYWRWFIQHDSLDDGINEGDFYYKDGTHATGAWSSNTRDLLLQIRVLAVDQAGDVLSYTTPQELKMTYNTSIANTTLSSFDFAWDATNQHIFFTNTSITFNLNWQVNVTYTSNPIVCSSVYLVNNGSSFSNWNVSFSTALLSTSYTINNRTLKMINLRSDWNGTTIFWDGIEQFTTVDNNLNILYSNGSTIMTANALDLSASKLWDINFLSQNYISSFDLENSGVALTQPYKANLTNILSPIITINNQNNGNTTLLIEDPDGLQIYSEIDKLAPNPIFSDWDINNTINQIENKFGTYQLECLWIDDINDRVGYYSRIIDLTVDTTLETVLDLGYWILGTDINLDVSYKSVHNNTGVNGATVNCLPSWDVLQALTNTGNHDNYTLILNTSLASLGATTITINANEFWHINRSLQINVFFVENTSMTVFQSAFVADFGDLVEIKINYLFSTSNTSGITGATVTVNSSSSGVTDNVNGSYFYTFDSTVYSAGNWVLEIEASKLNHKQQFEAISIGIRITITDLDVLVASNNSVIPIIYSENYDFGLRYRDTIHDELLDGTMSITNLDNLEYSYIGDYLNYYNFTFTMNITGIHNIIISFSKDNYQTKIFQLTFNITISTTMINKTDQTFNLLYLEQDIFAVTYTDTIHSLNLLNATIIANGEIIFLTGNATGVYQFKFNISLTTPGTYNISLTFMKYGYQTCTLNLTYIVNLRETELFIVDSILDNNSNIQLIYNNSHEFTVQWRDSNGSILNITPELYGLGISCFEDNLFDNFTFYGNLSPNSYEITIIWSKYGYQTKIFVIQYSILPRPTELIPIGSQPLNETTVYFSYGDTIEFEWSWMDTNSSINLDYWQNITTNDEIGKGIFSYINGSYYRFSYFYSGVEAENVSFILERFGYQNISFSFTIVILGTDTDIIGREDGTVEILFLESDQFTLSYNDTVHNLNITDADISITGNGALYMFFVEELPSGIYVFVFNRSLTDTGNYIVTITFSKAGYTPQPITLTYNILPRQTSLLPVGSQPTQDDIVAYYYGEEIMFEWLWYSSSDDNTLNSSIYVTTEGIEYSSLTFYKFILNYSSVDSYTVSIEFNKYGYINQTISFTIVINQAPSSINPQYPETIFYANYTDSVDFWLEWEENILHTSIIDTSPTITGNGSNYISFTGISGNEMNFSFDCTSVGVFTVYITLATANYQNSVYQITIKVFNLSTLNPSVLTDYPAVYESETITINIEWRQNETMLLTDFVNIIAELDGEIWLGFDFSIVNSTHFQVIINTSQMFPKLNNLTLLFELYGYESQNITLTLDIHAHIINVEIILPTDEISQGNVFDVIVYLTYNDIPLTITVYSNGEYSQKILIIYQEDSEPVINGEVNLKFTIVNEDDTTDIYSEILFTNSTGYAKFEIEASRTEKAIQLSDIQALYLGNDYNEASTENLTILIDVTSVLDIDDIMAIIEENIVYILGALILLLIIVTVSVKRVTKGKRKKEAIKSRKQTILDSFKGITTIQAVICRHDSGVPFYTENLFEDQQRDPDAIAGVSMAITTFVQELASQERKTQKAGTFERMEHSGFNMLSHHLNHSTVTLISSSKQTKFVENRLQKAHLEIQLRFQELLGDFYMPESINPKEVKVVLEKTLLLSIIKPLTIDLVEFKAKKKILSKNTKKIMSEYKEIPSFSTSVGAFFSGTIVTTMKRKGYANTDIVGAIIEAIDNDVLKTLTEDQIEEIGREHRVKEDDSTEEGMTS